MSTSIMSHENQRLRNIVLKQASSIAKIKPSHHAICKRLWTLSKDTGFAAAALTCIYAIFFNYLHWKFLEIGGETVIV